MAQCLSTLASIPIHCMKVQQEFFVCKGEEKEKEKEEEEGRGGGRGGDWMTEGVFALKSEGKKGWMQKRGIVPIFFSQSVTFLLLPTHPSSHRSPPSPPPLQPHTLLSHMYYVSFLSFLFSMHYNANHAVLTKSQKGTPLKKIKTHLHYQIRKQVVLKLSPLPQVKDENVKLCSTNPHMQSQQSPPPPHVHLHLHLPPHHHHTTLSPREHTTLWF